MNKRRQILLYGIGGPEKAYAVLSYYCIFEDAIDIVLEIRSQAAWMRAHNPSIKQVYMIGNRHGLRKEFKESIRLNSLESHMIFKDILEREGLLVQL